MIPSLYSTSACCDTLLFGFPLFFVVGIASHLTYFIRGERNKEAGDVLVAFLSFLGWLIAWCMSLCASKTTGLIVGCSLFAAFQLGLGYSIAAYRLFFHRARIFPGPLSGALTCWASVYVAGTTQKYHTELLRLHSVHGPVVRTGPREISICDVGAIDSIYGMKSTCLKGPWYDLGGTGVNLHRTRNPNLHARQRPLWENGFRDMSSHIDKVAFKTNGLIDSLALENKSVNVASLFGFFAFKLTVFIVFSHDFDISGSLSKEAEAAYNTVRRSQKFLGTCGHVPWYYSVAQKFPWLAIDNEQFTKLARRLIKERRLEEPETPDLLSFLLPTETDSTSAQFPLEWEARLAMAAGSGNVSSGVIATIFYIASREFALDKLRSEVDPLIETGTFDVTRPPPVLESMINESIRLQPLVPNGGERVTPPEGCLVGERWIPGDIILKVPHYSLFRDPRYFDSPAEWIPERWTTQKHLVKNRAAFIPFGTGPYTCVGRLLGIIEIRYVVARLVYHFDIRLAEGQDSREFENSGMDHFGMAYDKLLLEFKKRN